MGELGRATLLSATAIVLAACTGCPPPAPPSLPPPASQIGRASPAVATPTPTPSAVVSPSPNAGAEPKTDEPPEEDPQKREREFEERIDRLAARPTSPGVLESVLKEDKHLRVYPKEKRIEVDGLTCLKVGPYLELLACTRFGKTHESLLVFLCDPEKLHLGLILLGLKPSPNQIKEFDEEKPLKGDKVVVEVEWAQDWKHRLPGYAPTVRHFVEELIFDESRNGPMPRAGWVFTGSCSVDEYQPPDFKTSKKIYGAKASGTIAVTAHDPLALLDTSLPGSQSSYVAWADRLPDRFTPVIVHIRPWRDGDEKEEPFDPKKYSHPEGGGAPGGGPPPARTPPSSSNSDEKPANPSETPQPSNSPENSPNPSKTPEAPK